MSERCSSSYVKPFGFEGTWDCGAAVRIQKNIGILRLQKHMSAQLPPCVGLSRFILIHDSKRIMADTLQYWASFSKWPFIPMCSTSPRNLGWVFAPNGFAFMSRQTTFNRISNLYFRFFTLHSTLYSTQLYSSILTYFLEKYLMAHYRHKSYVHRSSYPKAIGDSRGT